MNLNNKKILLGLTSSISLYKACDLIQQLKSQGASVRAIITPSAAKMVAPITFSALTGTPVYSSWQNESNPDPLGHIHWVRWADVYVIAPCTANTIGEMAGGITGSIVSLCYLSFNGPVIIAPAMNTQMFLHPAVRKNLDTLKQRGTLVLPTGFGELACGENGPGKLLDIHAIVSLICSHISKPELSSLKNKKVLLVGGHTSEPIDDIRSISNRSSGKTARAIISSLLRAQSEVHILVNSEFHAPSCFSTAANNRFHAETTQSFFQFLKTHQAEYDIIIMAAALADFTPVSKKKGKLKNSKELKNIQLQPSPHVLSHLVQSKTNLSQVIVGFALENEGAESDAIEKWNKAKSDILVLNTPIDASKSSGFGQETVRASVFSSRQKAEDIITQSLQIIPKHALANKLTQAIATQLNQ